MSTVVVGVDGCKGSVQALRYAIDEARLHDAQVKVVNAWHIPAIAFEAGWVAAPFDLSEYPKSAQQLLDKSLEQAGVATSGVEVTTVVREGRRPRQSARRREEPTSWSSAHAGSGASAGCCSDPSASNAPTTPHARS